MLTQTKAAHIALYAAQYLRQCCGRYAARRYVINQGGSLAAYRLACQLNATKSI